MMGIKLKSQYKLQLTSKNHVSLFNTKNQNKQLKMDIDDKNDNGSDDGAESEEKDQ